jgi:serine protease Do
LITQLADAEGNASEAGPAAKAGLKPEDVIVEYDGKPIKNSQEFRMAVAETLPGQKVKVKAVRQGQEKMFDVIIAERVLECRDGKYNFDETPEKPKNEIGLEINNVPAEVTRTLEVTGGAYVLSVKPGSLADDAGLIGEADVIVAVNGKPVETAQEMNQVVKGLKSGEPMVLKFVRASRDERNRVQPETCYTSLVKP